MAGATVPLPVPGAPAAPEAKRRRRQPRWLRWVARRFHRHMPVALLTLAVGVLVVIGVLDFLPGVRAEIEGFAGDHQVFVGLIANLLVAGFAAALAYFLLLGYKREKALKRYRDLAVGNARELVDWSPGEGHLLRPGVCEALVAQIERGPGPKVAVVQGRAGTGRTGFVVNLVKALADAGLLPIPVVAKGGGELDLYKLAREKFCHNVTRVLSSDEEADTIWRGAGLTHDVVVVVDGLDDEVVRALSDDGGALRFRAMLEALLEQQFSVVLATTRDLPVADLADIHEDLDLFARREAEAHVRAALESSGHGDTADSAVATLGQLRDPVDGFRISPFYLDLIVRLHEAGAPPGRLPCQRDRWRADLLDKYLDAVREGTVIAPDGLGLDLDDPAARGTAAVTLAEEVARKIRVTTGLTAARDEVRPDEQALADAVNLNLLWHGYHRIGFAGDDLGAYLVAGTVRKGPSADKLLDAAGQIAGKDGPLSRRDRHLINSLIYWHLRSPRDARVAAFDRLLCRLGEEPLPRPGVVAAATRIAAACGLTDPHERLADAAGLAVPWLRDGDPSAKERDQRAAEVVRLVRALAEWPVASSHRLLWTLATTGNYGVEWAAAKALAVAEAAPYGTLAETFERTIQRAEAVTAPQVLADPDDDLGNTVASLGWVLPALRGAHPRAESQLQRVTQLLLAQSMSPLRGELSLAQGLKFAILNKRAPEANREQVNALLFDGGGRLRFWQARLVLVQAAFLDAWQNPNEAPELNSRLGKRLRRARTSHRLERAGVELARKGVQQIDPNAGPKQFKPDEYVWIHEREAVRWVEQGKDDLARLAADSVLLSNMLYLLRTSKPEKADRVATMDDLPYCIRHSRDRREMKQGCNCEHGLCAALKDEDAVVAARARFSENFCREQARLATLQGPPPWSAVKGMTRRRRTGGLEEFWLEQARTAYSGRPPSGIGAD